MARKTKKAAEHPPAGPGWSHTAIAAALGGEILSGARPPGSRLPSVEEMNARFGVSRVVITGIAADICVLFTAADAHMRAYDIWTPRDAVVSEDDRRRDWAIDIMANSMGAETRAASELSLEEWLSAGGNAQ